MFDERKLRSMVVRVEKMQEQHENGGDTSSGLSRAVGLIDDLIVLFE